MSRFGLALYFAFSTLAGPWLCCCLVGPSHVSAADVEVKVESCCCKPPAEKSPSPPKPEHRCPCRAEQRPEATVAKAAPAFWGESLFDAAFVGCNAAWFSPRLAAHDQERDGVPYSPGVRERLSMMCLLNC